MSSFIGVVVAAAMASPAVALLLRLEKTMPVTRDRPRSDFLLEYRIVVLNVVAGLILAPIVGSYAAAMVNAAGGGLVTLRSDGWRLVISLAAVILAGDVFAYLVHRAQHAIPCLWKMHSLHHSADSLALLTGARHFWIEQPIILALYSISMGLLFSIPLEIRIITGILYFLPDACAHANVRFSFGMMGHIINNPQYHRIHHSVCPVHKDKNFCKLLPLLDMIFGTAWLPAEDEFPETGLGYRPAGIVDAALWPLRPQIAGGVEK